MSKIVRFTATDGDVQITGTIGPRRNGVAGDYSYTVTCDYVGPDWSKKGSPTILHGSVYGGTVIAESPGKWQMPVAREVMDRCGSMLTPEWIVAYNRGEAVS